jgi:hypothetical protein
MRVRLMSMLFALFFVICCQKGVAQGCYDPSDGEYFPIFCSNSSGCHMRIGVYWAGGAGDTYYTPVQVFCCGVFWEVDTPSGSCQVRQARDLNTRRELLALSRETRILVAACDGQYRPIQAVQSEAPLSLKPRPILRREREVPQ